MWGWFKTDPKKAAKEEKKKKMQVAAKSYKVIRQENKAAVTGLGENKNKSKGFLDGYSDVIDSYIDEFGNEKASDENIDSLLQDYFNMYPLKKPPIPLPPLFPIGSKGTTLTGNDKQDKNEAEQKKHEEAMKASKTGKPIAFEATMGAKLDAVLGDTDLKEADIDDENSAAASKGINSAAMSGLKDISQWMLRNSVKTGVVGDTKTDFVTTYILKQPARVKLLAYYLVETDKRKETGPEALKAALLESQTNYVPNLSKFKDKMVASKFKFWKRLTADHFYWDKLSQSMRFAVANIDSILPFGSMTVHEETGGAKGTEPAAQQPEGQDAGGTSGQGQAADQKSPALSQLDQLAIERQMKFDFFINTGKELINARRDYEKTKPENRMDKEIQLKIILNRLQVFYNDLEEADKAVGTAYENFFEKKELNGAVQQTEPTDNKTTTASTYLGYIGKATQADGTLQSIPKAVGKGYNTVADKVNTIIDKTFLKDFTSWRLDKIPKEVTEILDKINSAGEIITIVGSSISLISAVLNTVDLAKHGSAMTAGTKAMKAMDIISDSFSAAKSITGAIQGLMDVSQTALDVTGGAMGAAAGGLNIVSGVTTLISSQVQKSRLSTASDSIMARKDLSEKERTKAENIAKLGTRLANTRQMNATIKTIAGGLQLVGGVLTATGVGAVVGSVIAGIGTVLNMTTAIVSYVRKKKNIIQTIDEYLNMNKMFETVARNVVGDSRVVYEREEKIKNQLRIEACARLGYPSKESLYNAITLEYATNIYNHIFFKAGDKSKEIKKEEDSDKDYLLLLKGLGLKADFSKKKPNINTIAKSLKNV